MLKMITPRIIKRKTAPDKYGLSTIPYNLSNNVIAMKSPSVMHIPYFKINCPGLRVGWAKRCIKSPISGIGHAVHQSLPKRMNVSGTSGHQSVQARIEPGLFE